MLSKDLSKIGKIFSAWEREEIKTLRDTHPDFKCALLASFSNGRCMRTHFSLKPYKREGKNCSWYSLYSLYARRSKMNESLPKSPTKLEDFTKEHKLKIKST